tara:strand:- start:64 stop:993 length:930 start_codon:yes stop_codon:yes gene_type:complete
MITALLLTVPARTHSVPAATATSWAWAPGIGVQVPTEPCAPNCEIDHFSTVPTSQPWHPWAALPRSELVAGGLPCPASRVVPPLRKRRDLGQLLRSYNLTGNGAELGVRDGTFTRELLRGWRSCAEYVQVDVWAPLSNYHDSSNRGWRAQNVIRQRATRAAEEAVAAGDARRFSQCANFTSTCVDNYADGSFDFIYVDARHDYTGVLQDLGMWWPKLAVGGVMAGHDYVWQREPRDAVEARQDPHTQKQDWTVNFDGTRDRRGRAVKGAVDDFFGGVSPAPYASPLAACPRQVSVTYRESSWNSWIVVK